MSRRAPRWIALAAIAALNLAVWALVAVAVGMLASDALDLGVEAFVRRTQATAQAVLSQLGRTQPADYGTPAPPSELPPRVEGQAADPGEADGQPGPGGAAAGDTQESQPGEGQASPAETPAAVGSASQAASNAGLSTPPLTSRPLLLADPTFNDLTELNAEMSCSAPGRAVQIRYQEEALNREIELLLAGKPSLPYQNVAVDLKPNGIVATGELSLLGARWAVEIRGKVVARDCTPRLQIESLEVGDAVAAGYVMQSVRMLVTEAMAWYPADYPLCLEEVVLEEGRVTVYAYRR